VFREIQQFHTRANDFEQLAVMQQLLSVKMSEANNLTSVCQKKASATCQHTICLLMQNHPMHRFPVKCLQLVVLLLCASPVNISSAKTDICILMGGSDGMQFTCTDHAAT
jgi:hypothetical protein